MFIGKESGLKGISRKLENFFFREIECFLHRNEVLIDVAAEIRGIVGIDRDAELRFQKLRKIVVMD